MPFAINPADQLRAAKALIDAPERWIKGSYANGKSGKKVKALGRSATCFCALGALGRAARHDPEDIAFAEGGTWLAYRALLRAVGSRGLVFDFNDHPDTTHADIMALFDRAISLADETHGETDHVA